MDAAIVSFRSRLQSYVAAAGRQLSTLFNKLLGQLTFITETFKLFKLSSCAKCIRYSWLFSVQYATVCSFKNWTLKFKLLYLLHHIRSFNKVCRIKGSPYSITERRVPELIPVLGSQPAGDVNHKPDGRLPLLSARPAVTPQALRGLLPISLLGEQRHNGCEQFA